MRQLFYIIIFVILLINGCKKENELLIQNDYPLVFTENAEVFDEGVIFKAKVMKQDTVKVQRFGFVWSESDKPTINDYAKILNELLVKSTYKITIKNDLEAGKTYYVRAYIETNTIIVYGNIVSFESKGSLAPEIIDFSPKDGSIGTVVKISGRNFSDFKKNNVVHFGNYKAEIDSANEKELVVKVPEVTASEKVKISIEVAGKSSFSKETFHIFFPWKRIADFPGSSRMRPVSFSIGNLGYVGLGEGEYGPYKDFWVYNPDVDKWIRLDDFPGEGREFATSFVLGKKAYVCLGDSYNNGNYTYYKDLWEFDSDKLTWTKKTDFPGFYRIYPGSFSLNGIGYVGLGIYKGGDLSGTKWGYLTDLWKYYPQTDRWIKTQDIPLSFYEHVEHNIVFGISYDINKVFFNSSSYCFLGLGKSTYNYDLYWLNMETEKWEYYTVFPKSVTINVNGFFINNLLYLGFGRDGDISRSHFYEFNPETKRWKKMQNCPVSMEPHAAFTIGEKGYIGIGWFFNGSGFQPDKDYSNLFYEFDPTMN